MSIIDGMEEFYRIRDASNIYAATRIIGDDARHIAESYDNRITHCEAISWRLTGIKPDTLNIPIRTSKCIKKQKYALLEDLLSDISDHRIRSSVRQSVKHYQDTHNLSYIYANVSDAPGQSRVRVLTRYIIDLMSKEN